MTVLSSSMQQALRTIGSGGSLVHLTTCSLDGKPNIVAERFVTAYHNEYILIADMFAQKTKVNLNENPVGCISVAHPIGKREWVFRGPCTVISHAARDDDRWHDVVAGDVLSEWGNWAEKEPPDEVPPDIAPPRLAQRGLIVLKVEEIFSSTANTAGQKIEK